MDDALARLSVYLAAPPRKKKTKHLMASICSSKPPARLFSLDIDSKDGQLYLKFESGASAQIDTMTLMGPKPDALEKYFGREVAAAVRLSHRYLSELACGETSTRFVSLAFQNNYGISCVFSLVLDPEALSTIAARLWQG